jgi:predicted AAA+ superfamily ATPase
MRKERYLRSAVEKVLAVGKMAFVGGPRQVGKTTMALQILGKDATEEHPGYLTWDDPSTAARLRRAELPPDERLLVLDEIHKYARWRNLVKGIYDLRKSKRRIIVTGSARLDYYRKGGDSLANRYRYFRLHPFSLGEMERTPTAGHVEALLKFGGFPEPLFRQDEAEHRIWQRDRIARVVREDLRDLEHVREVSLIEHLVELLPSRVSAPLSVKNLAGDLQVDHKTVEHWLQILENMYVCFRVSPFGAPRIRAVKKERKLYLWDWSAIDEPGPRFENLVGAQLLKYCHFVEDNEGWPMELRYLRDTDKREVDFVVVKKGKPLFAVECKVSDKHVDPALTYFGSRTSIPHFYLVHLGSAHFERGNVTVVPFARFCSDLALP